MGWNRKSKNENEKSQRFIEEVVSQRPAFFMFLSKLKYCSFDDTNSEFTTAPERKQISKSIMFAKKLSLCILDLKDGAPHKFFFFCSF